MMPLIPPGGKHLVIRRKYLAARHGACSKKAYLVQVWDAWIGTLTPSREDVRWSFQKPAVSAPLREKWICAQAMSEYRHQMFLSAGNGLSKMRAQNRIKNRLQYEKPPAHSPRAALHRAGRVPCRAEARR
jgi:hypothetical protein